MRCVEDPDEGPGDNDDVAAGDRIDCGADCADFEQAVRRMKDAALSSAFARWHDASLELLAQAKSAAAASDAASAAAAAEAEQQQHCALMVRRYVLKMMYKWMTIALTMWKFVTDRRFFLRNIEVRVSENRESDRMGYQAGD